MMTLEIDILLGVTNTQLKGGREQSVNHVNSVTSNFKRQGLEKQEPHNLLPFTMEMEEKKKEDPKSEDKKVMKMDKS